MTRRDWLAAAALGCFATPALAQERRHPRSEDEAEKLVEDRAKEVGLKGFHTSGTKNFVGIGDAPDAFRKKALDICEKLLHEYQSHFQFKNIHLKPIKDRLTVVTLADLKSFSAFSGMDEAPGVGGFYDRDTNRLVMFDNRALDQLNQDRARQANLVSLVHEATHQLTFNTGLLNRDGDVPQCLSEGFATYAEEWQPNRLSHLGKENHGRRQGLEVAHKAGVSWIPIAKLLADDRIFDGGGGTDAALQLAYAESWIFVYVQMTLHLTQFREYLKAIYERTDSQTRLEDSRAHLGDLDELDQSLRRAAAWEALGAG